MKFNKIAIAASIAACAFSAQAALPSDSSTFSAETMVNTANSTGQVVFISGASAVQKGFDALVTNLLDHVVYFNNDGSTALNSSGYVGVAGTLKAAAGTWAAGSPVIVIYRNSGGSVYGVNSVARAASIQSLDVTAANCGGAGNGTQTTPYKCLSNNATTRVPDAGMSDVAPIFFTNPVNTEGEVADSALTNAERALLSSKPMYAQAFGIPVTNTVPAAAVFNRATISAIMSGAISNWSKVPGAGSGPIVICRRTPGSGSQAVVNMWAGNYPCSTAAQVPLDRDANANVVSPVLDDNGDPVLDPVTGLPQTTTTLGVWDPVARKFTAANTNGGAIVIENDASGTVRTCLDKAAVGGTYAAKDRNGNTVTVDFGAGGYKAIGVLSLDSLGSSLAAGNWQFRSLDGAGTITGENLSTTQGPTTTGTGTFPTIDALTTGNWTMQGWTSFNIPTRTTGPKLAFLNAFLAQAQNPTVLASAKETKWTAAKIASGANTDPQTLKVKYLNNNQCAPLNRQY